MAMRLAVTYTLYATSLKEQTGNLITLAHFEEGNILIETRNDAESGDKYDNKSLMMSKQDIDAMNSGDESDHDLTALYAVASAYSCDVYDNALETLSSNTTSYNKIIFLVLGTYTRYNF